MPVDRDDSFDEMEGNDADESMESPVIDAAQNVPEDMTKTGKRVVAWPGKALPVCCPKCGAVVLLDRSTRACVVTKTREQKGHCIDRDMLCNFCGEKFIAREKTS